MTLEPASEHAALIATFYAAFRQRDHATMAGCYAPDAELEIAVSGIEAHAERGSAHWEAKYLFTSTGRRVHNRIDAFFHFRDGRIVHHGDKFSLYTWAGQALGWRGLLLGWSPPVQNAIRRRAADGLDTFIRKNGLS